MDSATTFIMYTYAQEFGKTNNSKVFGCKYMYKKKKITRNTKIPTKELQNKMFLCI